MSKLMERTLNEWTYDEVIALLYWVATRKFSLKPSADLEGLTDEKPDAFADAIDEFDLADESMSPEVRGKMGRAFACIAMELFYGAMGLAFQTNTPKIFEKDLEIETEQ